MNKKTTKRALLLSCLSMLLCVSMLVGSTFAWFTDTATTGVNTITSGNLDMKVSYKNATVTSWTEVSTSSKLFNDAALWEPGYTEVAYLKVENKGNLAFKYQLTVNVINEVIGTSVLGNEIKLSEVLKYDLIPLTEDTTYADRAAALAAVTDAKNLATEIVSGAIEANAAENYYALVVYMPETTGNEANHNGANVPSIQLGVNIAATQNTVENDSFNNQYDAEAKYPLVASQNVVAGKNTVIKSGDAEAIIPYAVSATAGAAEHTLTIEEKPAVESGVVITGSGIAYDIEITNIPENNTEIIPVTWFVGTGAVITDLYHDNVKMTEADTGEEDTYSYNADTGMLTIYITHFSEFALDVANEAKVGTAYYVTFAEAVAAAPDGAVIVVENDVVLDSTVVLENREIVIDGNGKTIKGSGITDGNLQGFRIKGGDVTVKNAVLTDFDNNMNTASGSVFCVEKSADGEPQKFVAENLDISYFNRDAFTIFAGEFQVKNCNIDCSADPARVNVLTKGFQIGNQNHFVKGEIVNTVITNTNSTYERWKSSSIEVYENADVVIDNCLLEKTNYGVYVDNVYSTSTNPTKVLIKNTVIDAGDSGYGAYIRGNKNRDVTLTLENCDISAYWPAMILEYAEKTKLVINGGNYDGYIYPYYGSDYEDNITITGGRFYFLPTEEQWTEGKYSYIPDGYEYEYDEMGYTLVVPAQ